MILYFCLYSYLHVIIDFVPFRVCCSYDRDKVFF